MTAAPVKFVPLIVTIVPPAIGPEAGEMPSIRGCWANAAAETSATRSETRTVYVRGRLSKADAHFLRRASGKEAAWGQTMNITRSGATPAQRGASETFTGTVHVTPLFGANDTFHASCASVSFEPGARSAWHAHPKGQLLIVTAGIGRVQQWGGPVEEIRQGDVIWTPPGVKHWHGASPASAMTHLALQEAVDGKPVEWMEQVSDEQYQGQQR